MKTPCNWFEDGIAIREFEVILRRQRQIFLKWSIFRRITYLPHSPLLEAPASFFRKPYAIVKVQSYTFVGYFHGVLCKKPQDGPCARFHFGCALAPFGVMVKRVATPQPPGHDCHVSEQQGD
jgi:hypothetical protein